MSKSVFETLAEIETKSYVEQKNRMNYIGWTYAWAAVKKVYPSATYEVVMSEFNLPWFKSDEGYMIHTKVTIEGETLMMWLPVMDGANKAMKAKEYKYKTKYGEKSVEACTTFDINKATMRCLVKNLAMFGFGINVYAGEDLPLELPDNEAEKEEKLAAKKEKDAAAAKVKKEKEEIHNKCKEMCVNLGFETASERNKFYPYFGKITEKEIVEAPIKLAEIEQHYINTSKKNSPAFKNLTDEQKKIFNPIKTYKELKKFAISLKS